MAAAERKAVVLDTGGEHLKAALEGGKHVFVPTVAGRPRSPCSQPGSGHRLRGGYVGAEALALESSLRLSRPVERGVVTHWDDVEHLWSRAFLELGVEAQNHPVLVTEAPFNPFSNQDMMVQLLFETFRVPAVYVALSGAAVLHSMGRLEDGLVLECGYGVTSAMSFNSGYLVRHACHRSDFAGADLTDYLARLAGFSSSSAGPLSESARKAVDEIKTRHCTVSAEAMPEGKADHVSTAPCATSAPVQERCFTLPDGKNVALGRQLQLVPEALFAPSLAGSEALGLHDIAIKAIENSALDDRRTLAQAVILSGGSVLFPNLVERLRQEIATRLPPTTFVKPVVTQADPRHACLVGGQIMAATLPAQAWITRAEYEESGVGVVRGRTISLTGV